MPKIQNRERRPFAAANLRVERRAGESAAIVGHAAVFDTLSLDLGGFRERIDPGAFAESILRDDIRALVNHDPNLVIGRNKSGTLSLTEDDVGLQIRVEPPDTQAGRDILESINRGDVSQMSFGFRTLDDDWVPDEESGGLIRTLRKVELYDVSPVTFPAYPDTDVAVRALEAWKSEHSIKATLDKMRQALDAPK